MTGIGRLYFCTNPTQNCCITTAVVERFTEIDRVRERTFLEIIRAHMHIH